jgi:hypothetical protein
VNEGALAHWGLLRQKKKSDDLNTNWALSLNESLKIRTLTKYFTILTKE